MGKYKILCTDLDGTLLNTPFTLSAENSSAITELAKRGVEVVPTTGRTFGEIPDVVKNHPDIRYIIHSNGAVLLDKVTGERSSVLIDENTYVKVNKILNKYETMSSIHYDGDSYTDPDAFKSPDYYRIPSDFQEHLSATGNFIPNYKTFFSEPRAVEMICTFFRYDSEMQACVEELTELGLYVTASEITNIEILANGAKKGDGLLRIAKKLSVDVADVIAVGDSRNDLALLSAAGLPLAVGNACEELKAKAKNVICTNREHIAKYILENFIK